MKNLNKKTKIIIAVVAAVIIAAGVAAGIYFGINHKPAYETDFSTVAEVQIIDDKNIIFSYTCPYISSEAQFRIDNKDGLVITYKDGEETKTLPCSIASSEYEASKTEGIKYGTLSLNIKLKENIKDSTLYNAVLKADSVSLKKEKYSNPDITADFSVIKTEEGLFQVEKEDYLNAKLVVPSNVVATLTKESGKAYFTITAQMDGITQYDKEALQNFRSFIALKYKNENGTFGRFLNTDVEFSAEDGSIYIRGTLDKEDLIPGQDYTVVIKKGFFTNDDKTLVNDDYECAITYVEK